LAVVPQVIDWNTGHSLHSSLDGPDIRIVLYGYSQIHTAVLGAARPGPAMCER
jgi:hypothetical protein